MIYLIIKNSQSEQLVGVNVGSILTFNELFLNYVAKNDMLLHVFQVI